MGNLANKMLEAMGIISDAAVASAGFDRSVQVQIIGLRDQSNDKEYRVSYNGAEKSAIGQPGYTSGELVWATVPGNDFSQNLQILGPVSDFNAASQVVRSQDDKFEKVSPGVAVLNINQQYAGNNNIILYEAREGEDYDVLGLNPDRIIDAINTSLFFEISTTIESKISSPTGNENFGIKCYFNKNTIGQNGVFTLDINDLSGNPYFLQEELQKKVFSISAEDRTLELLRIELFFENIPSGSEIKFHSFSLYGVREVDRENGLSATLQVVEGDTGRYISEDVYPYTITESPNPIKFKPCLRKDGIIVQDSALSNYSYQWYLKTLKNGAALRAIEPSLNDENFIDTTLNWEIDDTKLKQYKGSNTVVYIPNEIIVVTEYDKQTKAEDDEDDITEFPSSGASNTVYYSKTTKEYFIWSEGAYVSQTLEQLKANDSLLTSITSYGDGSNSLFRASNKVEAIVVKGALTYTDLEEGATVENTYFNNLNASTVFYNYTNGDIDNFRIINASWFIEGSSPNELNISQDAFFMPESWLYCKITDLTSGETTETNAGKIKNDNSLYDLEFNVGDIVRNGSKWNQTLGFGAEPLPNDLIFTWKKDDEIQEDETESRVTVEISPVANQNWSVEVERDSTAVSNFFITSASHEVAARANPQEGNTATIMGQTVFLLKEDGTITSTIQRELTIYLTENGEAVSDENLENFNFAWKLNDTTVSSISLTAPADTFFHRVQSNQNKLIFTTKLAYTDQTVNNTISCTITKNDSDFEAQAFFEPVFLKNGMPGTNGTDYFCSFIFDDKPSSYVLAISSSVSIAKENIQVINTKTGAHITCNKIELYNIKTNEKIHEWNDESNLRYYYYLYGPNGQGTTCFKAVCYSEDSESIWYAYLTIAYANHTSMQFYASPITSLISFSTGGKISYSLPITFSVRQNIDTFQLLNEASIPIDDNPYLQVSCDRNQVRIDLKESFQSFKGDVNFYILKFSSAANSSYYLEFPVLFLNNRYEYASINGWDGTSIKLDETNDTVLSPTAGFGKKESDNSFTGVMLGSITSSNSTTVSYSSFDNFPSIEEASNNTFYVDKSTHKYYVKRATETEGVYEYRESLPPDFSGILGMNHGNQTFSLNANNGNAWFKGHIEATSGKIGGVEIEAITEPQGRNLLLDSKQEVTNKNYNLISLDLAETPVAGQPYTVSICASIGADRTHILLYNSGGSVSMGEDSHIQVPLQNRGIKTIYTKTFNWVEGNNTSLYLWVAPNPDSEGPIQTESTFYWAKLESGTRATKWIPAPEDEMNTNSRYSWRFSPTEGMYMWHGEQGNGLIATDTTSSGTLVGEDNDDDNLLFRIRGNKLWMRGDGEFTGKITANEGEIAKFNIIGHNLYGYNDSTDKGCGMNAGDTTGYAFWAGKQDDNANGTTKYPYGEGAPFRVDHSGNFYATQGTFGPWTLSKNGLKYDDILDFTNNSFIISSEGSTFSISTDGIKLYANNQQGILLNDTGLEFIQDMEGGVATASMVWDTGEVFLNNFRFQNVKGFQADSIALSQDIKLALDSKIYYRNPNSSNENNKSYIYIDDEGFIHLVGVYLETIRGVT